MHVGSIGKDRSSNLTALALAPLSEILVDCLEVKVNLILEGRPVMRDYVFRIEPPKLFQGVMDMGTFRGKVVLLVN